jgi:hypothetical protein
MGIGSSVARKLSIDISGTNNNVMVIDGVRVHYDWSLLLNQIGHLVARENRTTTVLLVMSCLIVVTSLTVLATIGFFRLSSMFRSLECRMLHGSMHRNDRSLRANTPVTPHKQATSSVLVASELILRRSQHTSITIHRCERTIDRVLIHTM